MAPVRTPYLFDPARVRGDLSSYAALDRLLKPESEGVEITSFPGARKSERQLYRVLGNTHYPHLVGLLETLDLCLNQGYTQPRLLKTRARSAFRPDLSELSAAEHFIQVGCSVVGFDDTKAQASVPDFAATAPSGFDVAVEVYSPMAFEHLDRIKDDLTSGIKNLDQPYDFTFRLSFEKLREFDVDTKRLAYLFPEVLDTAFAGGRGDTIVQALLGELVDGIGRGDAFAISREESDLNLRIKIELDQVQQTRTELPARSGVTSGPNTEVRAPEWVFARIAENTEKKAREGQALTVGADAAVLIVDLTASDLPSELRNDRYRERFLDILRPRADQALNGHTAIAFVETAGWHKPLIPWFLNTTPGATAELFQLLDPRGSYERPEVDAS